MIKLNEVIVVEGKYDRIKLSSVIEGLIIETNGFRIFKDKKKMDMLRNLAKTRGIIILTDSDSGGFVIRNYLNQCIPNEYIKHVYIPDIFGKEKRKEAVSKEGKLGVEGMPVEVLSKLLVEAGVSVEQKREQENPITIADFYSLGFMGRDNSTQLRLKLLKKLNLPEHLSTKRLIEIINSTMKREQFLEMVEKEGISFKL